MNYRTLGKTGYEISEVSFGAWAIGGTWGTVSDDVSYKALEEAIRQGINFFDTADVYGDGRSERLLAKLRKSTDKKIYILTKAGRRLDPHVADGYTTENIRAFADRSRKNLEVDTLDVLLLHCPPTEVYSDDKIFEGLREMKKEGIVANFGVSVETVEEAMMAIEHEGVAVVEIIFNMFRHKPADEFFAKAKEKNVGIIARVPMASGMLTGKFKKDSVFEKDDHRFFNRNGEAFDKGETFSGVDYNLGLNAVEELKKVKPDGMTMAQFALKWILMDERVSCVIPGGKNPDQVMQNAGASSLETLSEETMIRVKDIYDEYIRESVHHLW